jgi:hypothetical protein
MAATKKRRKLMIAKNEIINEYRKLIGSLQEFVAQSHLHASGVCLGDDEISVYSSEVKYLDEFTAYLNQPRITPVNPRVKVYLISHEEIQDKSIFSEIKYGHFQDNEISYLQNSRSRTVEIFDKKQLEFYIITPLLEEFAQSITSFNLYYLKQILNVLGYVNMHGAVVGRDDSGIFLANKGGSGKSSIMAYAIAQGMQTLGDDFLTIKKTDVKNFYSLYRHFKLSPSSPSLEIAQQKFLEIGQFGEKKVFEISTQIGDVLRTKMRVKEVLIPYIGERNRIHEISSADALQKILPSTLFLNSANLSTIKTVQKLLAEIPVFQIELSLNLPEAFELLDSRL